MGWEERESVGVGEGEHGRGGEGKEGTLSRLWTNNNCK